VTTDAAVGGDAGGAELAQERWYLNDQREFLLRSIDDAQREYDAGDLASSDYDVLVARDRSRLAEVESELAALGPEPAVDAPAARADAVTARAATSAAPPASTEVAARRRYGTWSRIGIVAACLLILAGAGILVNHAVNPAAPGQPITGSTPTSKTDLIKEQLAAAVLLSEDGEGGQALSLYNKVLGEDPGDPVALAAGGWLEWNAGVSGKSAATERAGLQSEEQAVRDAPTFYGGHLYLGLILLDQDDNATGAVKQFTAFLADSHPASVIKSFAQHIAPAWQQLHEPLPADVAKALASSTTSTSSTTTSTTTTTTTTTTSAP
jgi:hypothetical protein